MKKAKLALILAAGAAVIAAFAGCADENRGGSDSDSSLSEESTVESTVQSSSAESSDSSSGASSQGGGGLGFSFEVPILSVSSSEPVSESTPEEEGIHLSECPVPAWGINESEAGNIFAVASEYDTYRVIKDTRFENGAVNKIFVYVYVISEDFDMAAFVGEWGFLPVWNGSYYEGEAAVPEEYESMTAEEIKLDLAKPLLKKYGSSSYDGIPEIVMVDPSVAPDPAFDF